MPPSPLDRYRTPGQRVLDKVIHRIDGHCAAFIRLAPFATLATASPDGWPDVSPRGGDPGFVRVLDEHVLAFPNYDGNGMYLSMGNVVANPQVGMLFIDFVSARPSRLRVNGVASIDPEDELMAVHPEAQFIVRVRATQVFPNCPRYIHRMALIERSRFVPRTDCATPVPGWKREAWASDVLPADDPGRAG